ncbi:hypothetical protein LF817_11295 [Halobacillus sp. A1]|uniref:hypothetical protein n=1 Tax=Halobacillus sp. A1 TaxID=2880262 RepID=UPI0020A641BE|nr:hypothetical protein [Halobacillus sp. A1]MCP3031930.1 hypothetical protein [Halobacillus sp. A1]
MKQDTLTNGFCEGFWNCISPADWLSNLLTFLAIAIPVFVTLVFEKNKAKKETIRRIAEERKPLKRELVINKQMIEQLLMNFSKAVNESVNGEKLAEIIKENTEYLENIRSVLLAHSIIRVDEIDRMRMFFGALETLNNKFKFKHIPETNIPLSRIYQEREMEEFLQDCYKAWYNIKRDYGIKR